MKIAVRRGHQYTGADGAAVGIVKEIEVAEDYHNRLINKLQSLGHEVLDVTPYEANRSLRDSLNYGINMANEWGAELFISCHVNNSYDSYEGSIGCEVIYCSGSSKGEEYAIRVEAELVKLGFKSRGAKEDTRGLAEIHKTNCPCIIVEPFFVEATEDVATYNSVGGEGIANAIVAGITGQATEVKQVTEILAPSYDPNPPTGENIFNIPNTPFYIEKRTDGDMSIHLDRGNYLTLRKGGAPEIYWNNNQGASGSKRLF